MEILEFLLIILMALLLFLTIYRLNDISEKYKRQSKRYNNLLRGRGELNLEELLISLSYDVDSVLDKVDDIESKSNYFQNKINNYTENLSEEFNNNIENINRDLLDKVDIVKKDLINNVENINQKYDNKIDTLNSQFTSNLSSYKEKMNKDFNDLSAKQEQYFDNLSKFNQDFKNKFEENSEKKLNTINDQLAFAVQRVSLYKYDAFEHQTGKLSFTLVLLDRFNNGVMITSINGRDSSYTYSKNIVNSKSELELSKEEKEALDMALKKK